MTMFEKDLAPTKAKVLLASNSPRRRELLKMIVPNFGIAEMRNVDESYPEDMNPELVAEYLSKIKAEAYKSQLAEDEIIITADTIVVNNGKILGKPKDFNEAFEMLYSLRNRTHTVITGVTLSSLEKTFSFSEKTIVSFSDVTEDEIKHYINNFQPFDKAGAYGIQEWIGCIGIDRIDGCFYNVMGLPLHSLYKALKTGNLPVQNDCVVPQQDKLKKVFVSGCYDMLHSGHVAFFKSAAQYGDLYVGIGSDKTILGYKNRKTVYSEKERLYMVKAIRYVKDAYINTGEGIMDFVETVDMVKPDVFVVNTDGGSEEKRQFCKSRGIEYIELEREPEPGLEARSSTALRRDMKSNLPYRIDLAGTWIDQPYVSEHAPGWALTISILPTIEFMERGGMSTSTRNAAKKIWPYELPNYNEEMLARLLFCFENDPEGHGHISGAQDSIGICMSGLTRHYYDNSYWPQKIEQCKDEEILSWLEQHVGLAPTFPRAKGLSVVEGKDINADKVKVLAEAANRCWDAIMSKDFDAFAQSYLDSFHAQVAMFPAMLQPGVQEHIDYWRQRGAKAWKMCGAGGGGYLALIFDEIPEDIIPIKIRR